MGILKMKKTNGDFIISAKKIAMLFVLMNVLIVMVGCTRQSNSTKIQLNLPDPNAIVAARTQAKAQAQVKQSIAKALSATTASPSPSPTPAQTSFTPSGYYNRVMVNISAPDLPAPIVWIQNSNDPSRPVNLSPSFDVPQGSGRLIQVLLIVQPYWIDSATGARVGGDGGGNSIFMYGDVAQDLNAPSQSVSLGVSGTGLFEGASGVVGGRLLDVDANGNSIPGPTGGVSVQFNPPPRADGSLPPSMILNRSEIHGGWFEFVAFEGLNFSYILENGRNLTPLLSLTGSTTFSLTPPSGINLGTNKIFVTSPSNGFVSLSESNSSSEVFRAPWSGYKYLLGYFGPGAPAANQICYDSVISTTSPTPDFHLSPIVGASDAIQWGGLLSTSSQVTQGGVLSGGVGIQGGICSNASTAEFTSSLSILPQQLSNGHNMLGTQGPFRAFKGTSGLTLLDPGISGATLSLKWAYLPGVAIDGVDVFTRTLATTPGNGNNDQFREYRRDDAIILCNQLTDPTVMTNGAFQKVGSAPFVASSATQSTTLTVVADDYNAGKIQVILCPYSNSRTGYFTLGLDLNNGGSGGGGGSGSNSFPVGIKVTGPSLDPLATANPVAPGVCTPLTVFPVDSSGKPTWVPANATLTVTSSVSGDLFYTDSGCTQTLSANTSPTQMGSTFFVYYKTQQTAGSVAINSTLAAPAANGNPAISYPVSLPLTITTASTPSGINFAGIPSTLMAFSCVPTIVEVVDANGLVVQPSANAMPSITLPISPSSPVQFYTDGGCAGMPVATPPVSGSSQVLFLSYTGASTITTAFNILSGVTAVFGTSTAPVGAVNVTINQPGPVASAQVVVVQNSFAAETCVMGDVRFYDASGNPAPAPTALPVTVNTNGSPLFYPAGSNCSSTPVPTPGAASYTIPMGKTSAGFALRETSTSATSISAALTLPSGVAATPSSPISVGPAPLASLMFLWPGQTYYPPSGSASSGIYQPTNGSATRATPVPGQIVPLSPLGRVISPTTAFSLNISQVYSSGTNYTSSVQLPALVTVPTTGYGSFTFTCSTSAPAGTVDTITVSPASIPNPAGATLPPLQLNFAGPVVCQ
jgi:hypothetical protein